jgi:hypothetical protein
MSADKSYELVSEILDYAKLVCADLTSPGYNRYEIEIGAVGFNISAKKVTGNIANPYWVVRAFSTFNA